jgi:hypothetical protein
MPANYLYTVFQLVNLKLFYLTVWIEVCSGSSIIHIEVHHFTVVDNWSLRHYDETDKLCSLIRAQALLQCFLGSSMQTLVHLQSEQNLHKLFPTVTFSGWRPIAFIIVFLTNNNFGHVCVPIKVSALLRYDNSFCISCYAVCTVIHHMAHNGLCGSHVFTVYSHFSSTCDK